MLAWWRCTITIPTPMTTWPLPLTSTQHINTNVVSFLYQRIVIHCTSPRGSSREFCVHLSSHPHALMKWATLLRLWSPLLPHAPPVALLPLLPALEVRRQPAHSAQREYGLVWRDLPPHSSRSLLSWKKNLPRNICGSGGDWQKLRSMYGPRVWTKIGKAAQNREKQEWKNEKPKLDNARRERHLLCWSGWWRI